MTQQSNQTRAVNKLASQSRFTADEFQQLAFECGAIVRELPKADTRSKSGDDQWYQLTVRKTLREAPRHRMATGTVRRSATDKDLER